MSDVVLAAFFKALFIAVPLFVIICVCRPWDDAP